MKSLEIVNEYIKDIKNSKVDRDDGLTEFALLHLDEMETIKTELEVLEILKKYVYYIDHTIKLKSISKSVYNFDYEKLKQWLEENENDRQGSVR